MFCIRMVGTRTEQLWTIRNPNVFGIRAPTVLMYLDSLLLSVYIFQVHCGSNIDGRLSCRKGPSQIQWGLEYRTFEFRIIRWFLIQNPLRYSFWKFPQVPTTQENVHSLKYLTKKWPINALVNT